MSLNVCQHVPQREKKKRVSAVAASTIQERARDLKKRRENLKALLFTQKRMKDPTKALTSTYDSFKQFGHMLYHLSPEDVGKWPSRALWLVRCMGRRQFCRCC